MMRPMDMVGSRHETTTRRCWTGPGAAWRRVILLGALCAALLLSFWSWHTAGLTVSRREARRRALRLENENRALRERLRKLRGARERAKGPRAGRLRFSRFAHGAASWYDNADGFATATGERFDEDALTCAMRTRSLFGRKVRVTNVANKKSVIVKVNDYGPASRLSGRVVDLSKAAFDRIGDLESGLVAVVVEVVT